MAEGVRERVRQLGDEVRALKASLRDGGLSAAEVNNSEAVQALVTELRDLKAHLAEDDDLTDEAFFERQRQEQAEREARRRGCAEEERRALAAAEAAVEMPLVQRKIFHLFCYAGSGDSFHYEPPARLNSDQTGFGKGDNPCPAVFITEKWDGTTMQATNSAIFRRQEVFGKRRSKDPSERYELKLVAWRDGVSGWRGLDFLEADRRVAEALTPYLERIQALDDGLCVYFECVHTRINATYSHLAGFADIRVFDFARAGEGGGWRGGAFLPFDEAVALASRFGLPLVGWECRGRLDAAEVWAELEAASGRHYATAAAPLEGFVVREAGGSRIAKARVEHVRAGPPGAGEASAVEPQSTAGRRGGGPGLATAAPPPGPAFSLGRGCSLSAQHLEAIGLLPANWRSGGSIHLRAPGC